ncbi:MAG: ATP-binding cassette domain-containing protein [Rhodospirillaceae bacterium]|nr:ATP-binding cassette domain-containing protein [Rhodospirillaceae bacterium]
MAPPPLLSLRDVSITFGGRPLFETISVQVGRGERCCLVGRNGSGKTTLLKVLAGEILPDSGERFLQPGTRIGHLTQDPVIDAPTLRDWVMKALPNEERDQLWRADTLFDALKIDGRRDPATLSGGEARRTALARALIGEPDLLLLDEPTNHLDLPGILWLEEMLSGFRGGLVTISHDRAFLNAVSSRTLWLDRGALREHDKGFADFPAFEEAIYAIEEAEEARMDKRLLAETHWLHRGVTARRRRNQGRLRALFALRKERAGRITRQGSIKLGAESGEMSGRLVAEAENITKSFQGKTVIDGFSTRIIRGDRVGIIGPNGAGKTTLIRLLTGALAPDSGTIRLGTNLSMAWFDQKREALDPDASLWDTLTDGAGDSVTVRGEQRHVISYLREFLFEDRQAHSPVRALSGGERTRLLLAKLLAKPSNLLILDEPTNDLDMDTLDLLEETLSTYEGTLIVVSHDRDFLDRLVTSVIAVEGNGRISEHVGGYSDYLAQVADEMPVKPAKPAPAAAMAAPARIKAPVRLSYKDQRELDELPGRIDLLSAEIAALEKELADPGLYNRDAVRFAKAGARLDEARALLSAAEDRWLELESMKEERASRS